MMKFHILGEGETCQQQIESLKSQLHDFLESAELSELCSILGTDPDHLYELYNKRKSDNGRVIEAQELHSLNDFEEYRYELYPLLDALGFMKMTEPISDSYTHILVPGASFGACYDRTKRAAELITDHVRYVDALTCFRPVNPIERRNRNEHTSADTEFGVLSNAFETYLHGYDPKDDFISDRNLNAVSCIRTYSVPDNQFLSRIYAAPSAKMDKRRANTFDCMAYYRANNRITADDSILLISNIATSNRQFLQSVYVFLSEGIPVNMDVTGCLNRGIPVTADNYLLSHDIQEIIALIQSAKKCIDEL